MNASQHHFNAADGREDFDRSANPGSTFDVSAFAYSFCGGLRGGPLRERLDPKLIDVQRLWSMLVVLYDNTPVAIAHVDEFENLGAMELAAKFMRMVEAHTGKVAL